jgi:uncharacterized oligopeptide transporter (OPT) family protein
MTDIAPPSPVTSRAYPELTWTAVGVGWILGVIIAISIGYAALILGFSIEGSELAAILGFGILRGILRRKSIIENNIVQTIASGVNGASSGMMFSVPAIFILGYNDQFDPVIMTFGCIAGAFLGIAFIIPLRKHMIDFERLTYPGGVAVATIRERYRSHHFPGYGIRKLESRRTDWFAHLHERHLVFVAHDNRRRVHCGARRRCIHYRRFRGVLVPLANAGGGRQFSAGRCRCRD